MSLLYYEKLFSRLNPNRSRGNVSPHKIAMLQAVMDLIAAGEVESNRIDYDQRLLDAFTRRFNELRSGQDRNNPHLPYFHLRSEGFWHHHLKPGQREVYQKLTTASGPGVIDKHIAHASLDDELFELLQNQAVRELLYTALYTNLELSDGLRKELLNVDGWDWLECEACVQDYFSMLFKEMHGMPYSKTKHREGLASKLNGRSKGSIEFKHQNISAVLVEMGFPYISGYKPRFNYQAQLREVVLAHLAAHQDEIDTLADVHDDTVKPYITDWDGVLDETLPDRIPEIVIPNRNYLARKPNYTVMEAANRALGESGEQFVIDFEKSRLEGAGRPDLAREVEWSSKDRGDGLGYDLRSFAIVEGEAQDREMYIEVKTTASGKSHPFLITDNELAFSREYSEQYSLYRVYDFRKKARLFRMPGKVDRFVNLRPKLYQANFS
ncbi:MAG: DUF3883 domain-containing protein [Pseudohongiellaceae bacterium]